MSDEPRFTITTSCPCCHCMVVHLVRSGDRIPLYCNQCVALAKAEREKVDQARLADLERAYEGGS